MNMVPCPSRLSPQSPASQPSSLRDLRERHDAACGGNSGTAPRLSDVIIDRTNGQMATNVADSAGGSVMRTLRYGQRTLWLWRRPSWGASPPPARTASPRATWSRSLLMRPSSRWNSRGRISSEVARRRVAPPTPLPAYVIPRDTVMVGKQGTFSCALLTTAKGDTTEGWIPTAALAPAPPTRPAPDAWVGHWRTGDQYLTISAAPTGLLHVRGEATSGSHDPDRVRRGGINLGQVEGTVAPQGNLLAFTEGDNGMTLPFSDTAPYACRIKMQRAGPFLWAWENGCGGVGVSFIGAYTRTPR